MPKAITKQEWFLRAKAIHGNTYDYSQVKWTGYYEWITLVCKTHGPFQIKAQYHIQKSACGCRKCGLAKPRKYNDKIFAERAKKVHGDKYDYSRVRFKHILDKVQIGCRLHGFFWQSASNHIHLASGCNDCASDKKSERLMGHSAFQPKTKTVTHKNGKSYMVQSSSEFQVLKKLVKQGDVKAQYDCPIIEYLRNKHTRRYRPDFYLPDQNRLVEVKSSWYLGIYSDDPNGKQKLMVSKAKAKAAKKAGYKFNLVVASRKTIVVLPQKWTDWSAAKIKRFLDEKQVRAL